MKNIHHTFSHKHLIAEWFKGFHLFILTGVLQEPFCGEVNNSKVCTYEETQRKPEETQTHIHITDRDFNP
jgi:hypothetical protein